MKTRTLIGETKHYNLRDLSEYKPSDANDDAPVDNNNFLYNSKYYELNEPIRLRTHNNVITDTNRLTVLTSRQVAGFVKDKNRKPVWPLKRWVRWIPERSATLYINKQGLMSGKMGTARGAITKSLNTWTSNITQAGRLISGMVPDELWVQAFGKTENEIVVYPLHDLLPTNLAGSRTEQWTRYPNPTDMTIAMFGIRRYSRRLEQLVVNNLPGAYLARNLRGYIPDGMMEEYIQFGHKSWDFNIRPWLKYMSDETLYNIGSQPADLSDHYTCTQMLKWTRNVLIKNKATQPLSPDQVVALQNETFKDLTHTLSRYNQYVLQHLADKVTAAKIKVA